MGACRASGLRVPSRQPSGFWSFPGTVACGPHDAAS